MLRPAIPNHTIGKIIDDFGVLFNLFLEVFGGKMAARYRPRCAFSASVPDC